MEEIDEFQEQLQISSNKDEDNEYSLVSSSSLTTKDNDSEKFCLKDVNIANIESDDYNKVPSLLEINHFRCSYLGCDQNFYDEECDECQRVGQPNQCFCILHKNHLDHYVAVQVDKNENKKNIEIEDTDVILMSGNANQLYIYNLLKCVTEVRV